MRDMMLKFIDQMTKLVKLMESKIVGEIVVSRSVINGVYRYQLTADKSFGSILKRRSGESSIDRMIIFCEESCYKRKNPPGSWKSIYVGMKESILIYTNEHGIVSKILVTSHK